MSVVQHRAVIVTCWERKLLEQTHAVAVSLWGGLVGPVVIGTCNGYLSFAVLPCGSKRGWDEQVEHKARAEKFRLWLESLRYEDGSHPIAWVEIVYGEVDAIAVESSDVFRPVKGGE